MNLTSIKTSEANHPVVKQLTHKFQAASENVVARFAIAYSIAQGRKFLPDQIKDSKGKEYSETVLFGKHSKFYIALICQHYEIHRTDPLIQKYLKIHLDDGLELMRDFFADKSNFTGFDFLVQQINRGLLGLEDVKSFPIEESIGGYSRESSVLPLKLIVGKDVTTNEDIYLNLNDTAKYNNANIAIAGKSGTGKTSFALKLLTQITEQSQGKINFIYLDFKGLDENKISDDQRTFLDKTKCKLVNLPEKPFPINPLSFVDLINEQRKIAEIRKFVDIVMALDKKLGAKQEMALLETTRDCFDEMKKGVHPTLTDIYERLTETYDKQDSLTLLLKDLTDLTLFADKGTEADLFESNLYLNLSPSLSKNIRLTATMLVVNYLYSAIMRMGDTPTEDRIKGIRYVILIDEAHQVFKERKAQELLENILRTVRSRGVSVMLLSQGIAEFDQPDFDFSSNCSTAFLMDINEKGNLKPIKKFLGFSDDKKGKITQSLSKMENYQAISNIKDYKFGELFNII
jgi:DNA sulfur modification protein DndE